jgi:DNA-binding CsgD family transcriptional regulator
MGSHRVAVEIDAAHPSYERLVEPVLDAGGLLSSGDQARYLAHIVLDYPLTWAIPRLEQCNSVVRARTLVMTQATHPVYLDCLASYHVAGVVTSTDEPAILSGVYAAASAQKTYQWRSGLTYMELRVTRLLLQGLDTRDAAQRLSISGKTVNAHVSNILGKLGYESRAQLIARLLGSFAAIDAADEADETDSADKAGDADKAERQGGEER